MSGRVARLLVLALAACGRVGFDPGSSALTGDSGSGGGPGDGAVSDSAFPGVPGGLLAWYPLDDDFALTRSARDISGNNYTAACTACPVRTTGRNGGFAGAFDGVQMLLVDTTPAAFDFPNGYTIAMWVRASPQSDNPQLVGRALGTSSVSFALDYTPMNGKVTHRVSSGMTLASANRLAIDGWSFAAISWDGSTFSLYLDTFRALAGPTAPTMDANPIAIGARFAATGTNGYFVGALADVMIFDRALTVPEVGQLYLR